MKRSLREVLVRVLGKPSFVVFAIALGVLLTSPSLGGGLGSDDHIQRLWVKGNHHCLDLFTFAPGDEALMRFQKSGGTMPWYADDGLKISFFRPLASITHCIDYRYLDAYPWLLHLQNLLWLGAAMGSAFALYRRTASAPWVAGLATLLFAIDDAHGGVVGWLANRNTLMATSFGLLAVTLHHRGRVEGSKRSAFFAPLAFLAALLSAEAGLAALAYLVSHALFLDRDRPLSRLRALWPYVAAVVAWRIAYVALGHGQHGSALYTNPLTQPSRFLSAALERAPILLTAQLGGPPSEMYTASGAADRPAAWLLATIALAVLALVLAPLLRTRPTARFFAFGMLLSVVPACATVPGDRLLMLVGVGGMGLVAELLSSILEPGPGLFRHGAFRIPAHALAAFWLFVHGLVAPLRLPQASMTMTGLDDVLTEASLGLFADTEPGSGVIVLHGGGNMYACTFASFLGHALGHAKRSSAQCLFAGEPGVSVLRVGASRLVLRPEGGFIDTAREPFWNADAPMQRGKVIELGWLRITVTEVSETGEPLEALFQFATSLDDPKLRLRYWNSRESRYADAPRLPLWGRLRIAGGEIVDSEGAQEGAGLH